MVLKQIDRGMDHLSTKMGTKPCLETTRHLAGRKAAAGTMGTTSKALTLLDCFTRQNATIGLSDLARMSGTNKATCFRLMTELQSHGLVEQTLAGRAYRIGPAVLRLAALREATVPTREAAMGILQGLARSTGETAHLSHLVAGRLTTIAYAYAPHSGVKVMMEDAEFLPFHATSSGLAVLAFLPDADRAAILARPMPALTPQTPQTAMALLDRLQTTRARGWAETANTYEMDVASLAVPLFDANGACSGAVAVAAPAGRMPPGAAPAMAAQVIESAINICAAQGGSVPAFVHSLWRRAAQSKGFEG
jgi:DNA-binding IclR family transcriptional regulator